MARMLGLSGSRAGALRGSTHARYTRPTEQVSGVLSTPES